MDDPTTPVDSLASSGYWTGMSSKSRSTSLSLGEEDAVASLLQDYSEHSQNQEVFLGHRPSDPYVQWSSGYNNNNYNNNNWQYQLQSQQTAEALLKPPYNQEKDKNKNNKCKFTLTGASGNSLSEFEEWKQIRHVAKQLAQFLFVEKEKANDDMSVLMRPPANPSLPYNILTKQLSRNYDYATASPRVNLARTVSEPSPYHQQQQCSYRPNHQYSMTGRTSYTEIREELSAVLQIGTQLGDRVLIRANRNEVRRANRNGTKPYCVFCFNNSRSSRDIANSKRNAGQLPQRELQPSDDGPWLSHVTKNRNGDVLCPFLQKCKCKYCGATGPKAHTDRYCPNKKPFDG